MFHIFHKLWNMKLWIAFHHSPARQSSQCEGIRNLLRPISIPVSTHPSYDWRNVDIFITLHNFRPFPLIRIMGEEIWHHACERQWERRLAIASWKHTFPSDLGADIYRSFGAKVKSNGTGLIKFRIGFWRDCWCQQMINKPSCFRFR